MARGRKALPGTHEARDYVVSDNFDKWIDALSKDGLSNDAKVRIKKAVLFGLGVKSKEEYQADKAKKLARLKKEIERETKKPIHEKLQDAVEKRKEVLAEDEDEYFAPEDCHEVE